MNGHRGLSLCEGTGGPVATSTKWEWICVWQGQHCDGQETWAPLYSTLQILDARPSKLLTH